MTSERESLLFAIAANPREDTPRLMYADWLDEHGNDSDHARAEFIRLQCELSHTLPAPRFATSMDFQFEREREHLALTGKTELLPQLTRCRDLFHRHGQAWLAELPEDAEEVVFHRGFPTTLKLPLAQFVLHGEQFLNRCPIELIHLSNFYDESALPAAPDFATMGTDERRNAIRTWLDARREADRNADRMPGIRLVAGCSHLSRVRGLDLSLNDLLPQHIAELLQSPNLPELQDFSPGASTPQVAFAVANCPKLHLAERLSFWFGGIGLHGAGALANSDNFRNLRDLELYANNLGDAGAQWLAGGSFPSLERLGLGYNRIGTTGLHALSHAKGFPRLTNLDVRANGFGDPGCEILARSPLAPQLRKLQIDTNRLTHRGVILLASAPFAELEELSLEGQDQCPNSIGPEGAAILANSPYTKHIHTLQLKQTELGDAGLFALADGPGLIGLRTLDVERNGITADGVRVFKSEKFAGLRKLVLQENAIDAAGCEWLAGAAFRELRFLDVEECEIGDDGLRALLRAPWFSGLLSLRLYDNDITDASASEFARSPAIANMTHFDISAGVGDPTAIALAASPHATNIRWLCIGDQLTDAGCRALAESPYLHNVEKLILTGNTRTTRNGRQPLWERFDDRLVFGGISRERDLAGEG
jgi:uncharacterized protein (TIGR02996 family)